MLSNLNSSISPDAMPMLIAGIVLGALALAQIIFVIFNKKACKDATSHIALGVLQIIFGDVVSGIMVLIPNKTTHKVGFVLSIITMVLFLLLGIMLIVMAVLANNPKPDPK
jgi:hypothetical protein